jgi:hypothetical protein
MIVLTTNLHSEWGHAQQNTFFNLFVINRGVEQRLLTPQGRGSTFAVDDSFSEPGRDGSG